MTARIIMKLRVVAVESIATDVKLFTLRHSLKPMLPPFEAGAHVDVRLPGGKTRQYSLCGDPQDNSRYEIAVKREADGRGGSNWIHENVHVDTELHVSAPRNNFPLNPKAEHHVFIGGGIGVTAMASMVYAARSAGKSAELHLCARTKQSAPLLDRLANLLPKERLHLWLSRASGGRHLETSLFAEHRPGVHIYCCGPDRLIEAVRDATKAWPEEQIHFEVFAATADENFKAEPFDLKIRSTGEVFRVPADQSAMQVLAANGHLISASCEMGVCGSCACEYSDGEVIHRDRVLGTAARQNKMMVCVSRARNSVTLDL